MKKTQVWFPLFFALTMIVGMWVGFRLSRNVPQSAGFFQRSKSYSLQEVMDLVKTKYVDSINADSLTDDAIQAMLMNLDPHSVYIPAVYTEEANEDLKGNFQGIGVEYYIIRDTVNVSGVLKDGPSDRAGLQVGDKFIKVGDSVVAGNGITTDRIKALLRGEDQSQVQATLLRDKKTVSTSITRGIIPKHAVDASYMIDKQTGFIHLNKFSQTSYEEFMQAMERLQKLGLKKLILDLRGNNGGILGEAVDIADEFLDGSKLVVYTRGVHAKKTEYECKRPGLFETGELVVLVDEFSASASEVLAGALQDWDRATIVGRRTFGKGLVQEPFVLTDGSQLRLTVSRYYTPVGRNIQKPFAESRGKYNEEVYERFHNGQSVFGDTNSHKDEKVFTTPKGKKLYGGGGISPDIFVPIDTATFSSAVNRLFYNGIFSKFIYTYYLENRAQFSQYKNATEFATNYYPGPAAISRLESYAAADSINITKATPRDREYINERIKTYMARQIWRMQGFYEVSNITDATVQKAIQSLKK